MNIKQYLRLYRVLIKFNLIHLITHRGNFINNLISTMAWGIFSFISIFLLTSRNVLINGWNRNDLILLTATYSVFVGIFHMLFSVNFNRMVNVIHYGQLDGLLLKPIDSQFSLSAWHISFTHISRIIMGIVVSMYLLYLNRISVNAFQIINYLILIIVAQITLYSIWFIIMTTTIRFSRLTNLVDVMYTISSVGRYPKEIYQQASALLGIILTPFILPINIPTNILLGRSFSFELVVLMSISIALFIFSRKFWQFALRFYTSASG